jgi:glycerophosphoryl diester phosphodiesterase
MREIEGARAGRRVCVGHRGAAGHAPENTMASFEAALRLGADAVELDVRPCRDGELVVIHDAAVDRTTDGKGEVAALTLDEIRRLDAGARFFGAFRNERIPTLRETLAWAAGRTELVVEIKGDPHPRPGVEEQVVRLIADHGMVDRVMVISFHHPSLRRVRELEPGLATGMLYTGFLADTVAAAGAAGADCARPMWRDWNAPLVQAVHGAGLVAGAWTADEESAIEMLLDLGIDSITSNYPDRVRRLIDRRGLGLARG